MKITVKATYIGPTDTLGTRIRVSGPFGQYTQARDYSANAGDQAARMIYDYLAPFVDDFLVDDLYARMTETRSGWTFTLDLA